LTKFLQVIVSIMGQVHFSPLIFSLPIAWGPISKKEKLYNFPR
jgi:hypothetical protein